MVLSWFWLGFALVSPWSCLVLAWIAVWLSFLLVGVVFVCFVHLFSAPVRKFFRAPLVLLCFSIYILVPI